MTTPAFLIGKPTVARTTLRWAVTLGLIGSTAFGIRIHADRLLQLREQGLPLAAELPPLERKLSLLTQEVQLSEVQHQLATGSDEERLQTYVLPDTLDRSKVVGFLDAIRLNLQSRSLLMGNTPMDIGTQVPAADGEALDIVPIHTHFTLTQEGIKGLLAALRISGFLTVADALPPNALADLLRPLEAAHPADIVSLEQFLSTDLYAYAQDPRTYEDRLLQSVSSETFGDIFRTVKQQSLLPEAHDVLSQIGQTLLQQKLWPSPFFAIKGITMKPATKVDFSDIDLELETYVRK